MTATNATPELPTHPATPAERAAIAQATVDYLHPLAGRLDCISAAWYALGSADISDIEVMVADQGLLAIAYYADWEQHTVIIYTRDHGAAPSPWRVLTLQTRQHATRMAP